MHEKQNFYIHTHAIVALQISPDVAILTTTNNVTRFRKRMVCARQCLTMAQPLTFLRFFSSARLSSAQVSDYIEFRNHLENCSRIQQSLYQFNQVREFIASIF